MNNAKNIILIFLISFMPSAWSSQKSSTLFNIQAGEKKLSFQKMDNLEWSQYCFDTKMGCARFVIKRAKAAPTFGYVKVVTDQLASKDFNTYCKEVFKISSSSDKTLNKFNIDTKAKLPHCSWMGQKDTTHFFWKNGVTVVVNTNDQFNVEKIVSEAKLHEKR